MRSSSVSASELTSARPRVQAGDVADDDPPARRRHARRRGKGKREHREREGSGTGGIPIVFGSTTPGRPPDAPDPAGGITSEVVASAARGAGEIASHEPSATSTIDTYLAAWKRAGRRRARGVVAACGPTTAVSSTRRWRRAGTPRSAACTQLCRGSSPATRSTGRAPSTPTTTPALRPRSGAVRGKRSATMLDDEGAQAPAPQLGPNTQRPCADDQDAVPCRA